MAWIQSIPYSNDKGWWHYHKRWLDGSIDEFTAERTVRRTGSAPCCWRHDLKSRTCPWILSPPPSCSLLSPSFDSWRFEVPLSQNNGVNQWHSKIFETISQHSGFKLIFSDILSQQQKVTNMVQKKKKSLCRQQKPKVTHRLKCWCLCFCPPRGLHKTVQSS